MGARGAGTANTTQNVAACACLAGAGGVIGLKNASRSQRFRTIIIAISTTCVSLRSDPQALPRGRPAGHGEFHIQCFIASASGPALFLAGLPDSWGQGAFLCRGGIALYCLGLGWL